MSTKNSPPITVPRFSITQAADYLGVSVGTIRTWADAGHLKCFRTPGDQRRFSQAHLEEFINKMEKKRFES